MELFKLIKNSKTAALLYELLDKYLPFKCMTYEGQGNVFERITFTIGSIIIVLAIIFGCKFE